MSGSISFPFLKHRLKREVTELYISVMIQNFANSMVSLFAPIYLLSIGYEVYRIVLFFFLLQFFYFFILPLGGKVAVRVGFEHSILYSIPFIILFLTCLYFIASYSFLFYVAPLLGAIGKALFWPAYHADLAYYGSQKQTGSEISMMKILALLSAAVGPFAGGLILNYSNFGVLIITFAVVMFASIIPLFSTKERFEPGDFSYWYGFKQLFLKGTIKRIFGLMGFGEQWVAAFIWPLFIYTIIKTYFYTGLLVAGTTLITVIFVLIVGKIVDRYNEKALIRGSAILHFFIWIGRIFAITPMFVFFTDLASRMLRNSVDVPVFSLVYARARRTENYMKTIVVSNLGINLGKTLIALIILVIFCFTDNLVYAFIPAAAFSLLYLFI